MCAVPECLGFRAVNGCDIELGAVSLGLRKYISGAFVRFGRFIRLGATGLVEQEQTLINADFMKFILT